MEAHHRSVILITNKRTTLPLSPWYAKDYIHQIIRPDTLIQNIHALMDFFPFQQSFLRLRFFFHMCILFPKLGELKTSVRKLGNLKTSVQKRTSGCNTQHRSRTRKFSEFLVFSHQMTNSSDFEWK
jgi:hypothetical protein